MREPVGGVPRDLLGEEPPRAGEGDELREGRGVAEGVRQPHLAGLDAELVEEEALAVAQLAGQRLTTRQVRVGLDPHAADRHEPALVDALDDPGPDLGPVVAQPRVLLRRRHREDQLGVGVHQVGDVGAGASDLAHRLADRPQPGRVDVGVADGGEAVRAGPGRRGQHLDELGARRGRGAREVGDVQAGPWPGRAPAAPPTGARPRAAARPRAGRAPRGPARAPTPRARRRRARPGPPGRAARGRAVRWSPSCEGRKS